jgi:hypothetical protein
MNTREWSYRGVFATPHGTQVRLDFWADSKALALDHAGTLARDAKLTVVKVTRLPNKDDAGLTAGKFLPMEVA